jgi:hypothetical protein
LIRELVQPFVVQLTDDSWTLISNLLFFFLTL